MFAPARRGSRENTEILYHGAPNRFEGAIRFDIENREDAHANGCLGFWVATDEDLARRFGGEVLEIEVDCSPGKAKALEISDLARMSGKLDADGYRALRDQWLADGFTLLHIVEKDGSAPTRVILSPNAVLDTRWLEPAPTPSI